ncbi:Alpha/Beta hydrolase protein [Mariannaea sp. PMI_226]|nr:Alpha/Beta hydrolase protein [Mariannaea sp. PMI_226]
MPTALRDRNALGVEGPNKLSLLLEHLVSNLDTKLRLFTTPNDYQRGEKKNKRPRARYKNIHVMMSHDCLFMCQVNAPTLEGRSLSSLIDNKRPNISCISSRIYISICVVVLPHDYTLFRIPNAGRYGLTKTNMESLPDPTLTLTLPSLHDGLTLDCRVYHPLSLAANPRAPPWQRHAAVIAHPYAPLGGSYDDPVVDVVASQLLRKGFLVGTFNFRGAGGSAGRTSWTSKAERLDYTTVLAFILHYVHHLDPFRSRSAGSDALELPSDASPPASLPQAAQPTLIMGGYSYGAMITTQLPPLYAMLQPFASPEVDSNAAEVRLRAEHLAGEQNVILASARAAILERGLRSPSKRGVRIGGDEGGSPRKSHDGHHRRSFSFDEERIRRGVHDLMAKARPGRHSQRLFHASADSPTREAIPPQLQSQPQPQPQQGEVLPAIPNMTIPRPAYLLVSPLQGLINHLATMSLVPSSLLKNRDPASLEAEEKLVRNPTCAIFGDMDVFVAANRLRAWASRLQERKDSRFRGHEIPSAGHFWIDEDTASQMRDEVSTFAEDLLHS